MMEPGRTRKEVIDHYGGIGALRSFHHHLVHEGGWKVNTSTNGLTFSGPDGHTATIGRSRGNAETIARSESNQPITLAPATADRIVDLPWITTLVLHNENLARQQRAA